MRKVPQYTLQRVVRDCPANDRGTNPAIYDFEILINGEHRATLRKNSFSRGYEMMGLDDDHLFPAPVPENENEYYHRAKAEKQADFVPLIDAMIMADRFPTIEDFRARELGWGRALLETRDCVTAKNLGHAVQEYARSFYDLAMLVAAGADMVPGAKKLLAKVQARQAQMEKNQDEMYQPSKWEAVAIAAFTASLKTGDA